MDVETIRLAAPPITRSEWDAIVIPEAYRAEIVQGEIVLSPGVRRPHVLAQGRLFRILDAAAPRGLEVGWGAEWSFDVQGVVAFAPIPDLVVVPHDFQTPLVQPPILAVEILSKSDHRLLISSDLTRIEGKRLDYGRYGLLDYLEIDPLGPEVVARRYENVQGHLSVVEEAVGEEVLRALRPFAYEITPATLTA